MLSASKGGEVAPVRRCDALVAGAGPAGAIAARQLALSGLSVVVADRLSPSEPKVGETLPGAAIRLLKRLGLGAVIEPQAANASPHGPVSGLLIAWNGATLVASDALDDPYGQGLRLHRPSFDVDLRRAAEAADARLWPADVTALERSVEGWLIWLDDGALLSARWLIDATGRRARLSRLIGARRRRSAPLVAIYKIGWPERNGDLTRTVIAAGPDGWVYAGRLGDGRWAFGYHTSSEHAARMLASPADWDDAVCECPGLAKLFGKIGFAQTLSLRDARGARVDPPIGDGWVACGDAALSFDPIAGQGLFNALYTGMTAAEAVRTMRDGAVPSNYASELDKVAAIYNARRREHYRQERRWSERSFWRTRHEEGDTS